MTPSSSAQTDERVLYGSDHAVPGEPILTATDIKVHFGGVRALDGVSLSLEPGELLGIVGPNGSGKSTLLGALSRLTRITDGSLELDGQRYDRIRPAAVARMGLSRTFQTVRLLPRFSVLENVMLGADQPSLRGARSTSTWRSRGSEKHATDAAMEALERIHLADIRQANPADLPYGVQRKVEIARALVRQPSVLLYDEPIAGMSRSERDEIADLMVELAEQGLSQILVEHDIGMVVRICRRLIVLDLGKKIADGPSTDVITMPEVRDAYLGGTTHASA